MKRCFFLLVLITTLLVMALSVSAAMARPASDTLSDPTYSSTIYPCKYDYAEAREWVDGDRAYARDVKLINIGETVDEKNDEWEYDVKTIENLNWNFDLTKGKGWVWGNITQEYSDEHGNVGLWVGAIIGKSIMNDQGVPLAEGKGFFYGKGLFKGLRMRSNWRQETHSDQPAKACKGHEPQGEDERVPLPVKTLIDHYVIETGGGRSSDD